MDYKKIDGLVEKFWAGETTVEEEQTLKNTFQGMAEVPEMYREIAAYFQFVQSERETMELDDDFESSVLAQIKEEEKTVSKGGFKGVFYLKHYARVAAILLVGLLSFKLYNMVFEKDLCENQKDPLACMDTFENPEEAYELLKEQLLQVSIMMNKGQGEMSKISKFNEAQELLKKQ